MISIKHLSNRISKAILERWDWWVYQRACRSMKRICDSRPGISYLFELQIKDYNQQRDIPDSLRRATESFYESYRQESNTQINRKVSKPIDAHVDLTENGI